MKSWIKGLALGVAVTCVVWIGVLWHWRSHPQEVGVTDLWIYLGVLPLVVWGLLLAGRWALTRAWQKQAGATAAAEPAPLAAGEPAPVAARWWLMGQWLQLPAAQDAAGLLDAVEAGAPRPTPDAELRDDQGLPVLSARTASLDTEAIAAEWPQPTPLGEAGLRALASLQPVVEGALGKLQQWGDRLGISEAVQGPASPAHRVRVLVHWPDHWSEAAQTGALQWLRAQLDRQAGPGLPTAHWPVQVVPGDGVSLLMQADKLLETLARQACDDLVLTLACHSDLDSAAIDRLLRERALFQSQHQPRGVMPGEGAVGLLWATQPWPQDDDEPGVLCSRPQAAHREQSVDAPGRTRARELTQAVDELLSRQQQAAEQICALVTDSDQHTARATELFAVSLGRLPQLDPAEDMRLLGPIVGHLAGVAPLLTLAAGADWVAQGHAPLLAVSVGDRHARLVASLDRPEPASSPDASA